MVVCESYFRGGERSVIIGSHYTIFHIIAQFFRTLIGYSGGFTRYKSARASAYKSGQKNSSSPRDKARVCGVNYCLSSLVILPYRFLLSGGLITN